MFAAEALPGPFLLEDCAAAIARDVRRRRRSGFIGFVVARAILADEFLLSIVRRRPILLTDDIEVNPIIRLNRLKAIDHRMPTDTVQGNRAQTDIECLSPSAPSVDDRAVTESLQGVSG